MVARDRFWAVGPVTAAAFIGVPAGIGYGLLSFAIDGSVPGAAFSGVFFGVTFGALMAWWTRRQWPRSSALTPEDRVAVSRSVRTGEKVSDDRLTDAVVDYAAVIRRSAERDTQLHWMLVVAAVATAGIAIVSTVDGQAREAIVFWLLTAFWVVQLAWLIPRQHARAVENARRAAEASQSPPTPTDPSSSGERHDLGPESSPSPRR